MHENQLHDASWFVTLTYSDERLPENGSLCSEHLQRFFRSVRREWKCRYFACGEYGETTQRPHYHAVLFGPDFLDKRVVPRGGRNPVWRSEALDRHWPHGFTEFSTVTRGSAAYTAGYVRKKVSRKANEDAYLRYVPGTGELVEVEPEFSRMSLRPAIGRKWLERYWEDVYPADKVVVDGYEAKPPRYYDKVMDGECKDGECFTGDCGVHQEVMMHVREKRLVEARDLTAYQLEAGEAIHKARVGLFQRRIVV